MEQGQKISFWTANFVSLYSVTIIETHWLSEDAGLLAAATVPHMHTLFIKTRIHIDHGGTGYEILREPEVILRAPEELKRVSRQHD